MIATPKAKRLSESDLDERDARLLKKFGLKKPIPRDAIFGQWRRLRARRLNTLK